MYSYFLHTYHLEGLYISSRGSHHHRRIARHQYTPQAIQFLHEMERFGGTDVAELSSYVAAYPEKGIGGHLTVEKDVVIRENALVNEWINEYINK